VTRLAVTLLLTLGMSCGAPATKPKRGGTWYGSENPPPKPPPAKKFGPWALASTVDDLFIERESAPTEHLSGGFSAEIRVSSDAKGYGDPARSQPLPEGAMIVEVLRSPGSDVVEAFFVMLKRAPGYDATGHDWEYLVVRRDAQIEDRGRIALCARCHAEASSEHLFGPLGAL